MGVRGDRAVRIATATVPPLQPPLKGARTQDRVQASLWEGNVIAPRYARRSFPSHDLARCKGEAESGLKGEYPRLS